MGKSERSKNRREKIGSYFFDLSKLTFAAIVLGELLLLQQDTASVSNWMMAGVGSVITYVFAKIGDNFLK